MENVLEVTLTKCRFGKPLAIVRNLPGFDAEMRPAQMRALAKGLIAAADECGARPMGKRSFAAVKRSYPLEAS